MQKLLCKYNEEFDKNLYFRHKEINKNEILSSINLLKSNAVGSDMIYLKTIHICSNLLINHITFYAFSDIKFSRFLWKK